MDNRNLYKHTFYELKNWLNKSGDGLINFYPDFAKQQGKIFDLGGNNFYIYSSIVKKNESKIIKSIEDLFVDMCKQNNINFEKYPSTEYFRNENGDLKQRKGNDQLIITEKGSKVKHVFIHDANSVNNIVKYFLSTEHSYDALKIVILGNPEKSFYDTTIREPNSFYQKRMIKVTIVTLKELFDALFGKEEFLIFMEYVTEFHQFAKETIGFNAITTPTNKAIEKFKKKVAKNLVEFPYKDSSPDIYDSNFKILFSNYIERGLWKAMVGTSNFANSFIASEWNFEVYKMTENLDLTGMVAGYLKSIEQLLFEVIYTFRDQGVKIRSKNGKIIDLSSKNKNTVDTTLGSLEAAVNHNENILEVNHYVKRHIVNTIRNWREEQRNGFFHKDNLHSIEKVEKIRKEAIYLYFLILGGFKIQDGKFLEIGILNEEKRFNDFQYNKFIEWFDVYLSYITPEDASRLDIVLYHHLENRWEIQLSGISDYSLNNNSPSPIEEEIKFSSGTNYYSWDKNANNGIVKLEEALQRYLKDGLFSKKLKQFELVTITKPYETRIIYRNKKTK